MIEVDGFDQPLTGYIGGAVLSRLIHDPEASRCQVTVLVRNEEKARALRSFQVKALVGSLDDVETIRSLAAQADVVYECVSASSVDFRDKSQTFLR